MPQHVIQRGVNGAPMFVTVQDRMYFLELLLKTCVEHACAVHAYVLMTNHVHLLMSPTHDRGVSDLMQALGTSYVRMFNNAHRRYGTLWQGRFRSAVIDSGPYLLNTHQYIEQNPVNAQMVAHPSQYPWSSHRANAFGEVNPVVTPHPFYLALGNDPAARHAAYQALFFTPLEQSVLDAIRRTTRGDRPLKRSEVAGETDGGQFSKLTPIHPGSVSKTDPHSPGVSFQN